MRQLRVARHSTSLVRTIVKRTRPDVLHRNDHTSIAASIAYRRNGRTEQGASAKPALLGPMSSDGAQTLTHALVAGPYSSDQVRVGGLSAVFFYTESRVTRALTAYPDGTLTS